MPAGIAAVTDSLTPFSYFYSGPCAGCVSLEVADACSCRPQSMNMPRHLAFSCKVSLLGSSSSLTRGTSHESPGVIRVDGIRENTRELWEIPFTEIHSLLERQTACSVILATPELTAAAAEGGCEIFTGVQCILPLMLRSYDLVLRLSLDSPWHHVQSISVCVSFG